MNKMQVAKSCSRYHATDGGDPSLFWSGPIMPALTSSAFVTRILSGVSLDIRRPGTFVRRLVQPGFEIGHLLDEAGCNIGVRDGLGKFQKRGCLLRQILSTHHF